MAPSKTLKLPLRGNVVDLVQHHNWLLIAAHHSEGHNLGIQIVPIHNLTSRVAAERWILHTPKPIQRFVSLPNVPVTEDPFVVNDQELDVGILNDALQKSSQIRSLLQDKLRRSDSSKEELSETEKLTIVYRELKVGSVKDLSQAKQAALTYFGSIVDDQGACRALQKKLDAAHEKATFGTARQQGQRIACVDVDGQGYHVPYIPVEADFDGNVEGLNLKPFVLEDKIEFIEALASNRVLLVVRRPDSSQWVCLYDLDSDAVVFEMSSPEPHRHNAAGGSEENQEADVEASVRVITSLATDVATSRFALGFDDGLYLWFDPSSDGDFKRQELKDSNKSIMTSANMKKEVNHTGAIIGLAFSNDFESDKPFLTAFCDDLTTSRIRLHENIPSQKAKASNNAHSKRIRQVLKGPGHHFYTLSLDNTLRMWQTSNDLSSGIPLRGTCVTTAAIPVQDRYGKWAYNHFLISGHDGEKVSGHNKRDSAVISFRIIQMYVMDPTERTGKVEKAVERSYYGVWSYAIAEMKSEPKKREALLEYIGTLNDQLAVDLLMYFVRHEENPEFVGRALELLNATKHSRLIILFTELMSVNRASTCLQVLEYLRTENIYGPISLYPLELADQSRFLEVRQAALRGFAGLASQRDQGTAEENTTYQMAFERILSLFNDDREEDIVANAFELLFSQKEALMPGVEGILLALAHKEFWVQRRALMLIYLKGMIDSEDTTEVAQDLLRQMRESNNEDLRVLAFRLSLFAKEGVQQYLRSLDDVLHNQMSDLETERSIFVHGEGEGGDEFVINSTVEQLFLDAVPEEDRAEKEVDMEEAKSIVSAMVPLLAASKKSNHILWSSQTDTFSYCVQTFPMTLAVKDYLEDSEYGLGNPAATFDRDLTNEEKVLLQEMALSYQPSIASLGAMALAKQGEHSALPILLQLVDDKDDLVKSRSVDGLLEFINEPIVEHKLRLMVLQAENEQVKRHSRDKADSIRTLVRQSSFSITQRMVTQIVDLIFEDDVYSHSERLAVRYLFESSEVTFTSDTRHVLFKQICERGERPKLINIRAKILRALYRKANSESDVAIQHLIAQTLESPFDDVRILAVVRLQKRIDDLIEGADDWTAWPRFTAETWSEYVKQHGGGLISGSDIDNLTVQSPVNPLTSLVGIPEPLLTEVQLLNRVLFWRGHEALNEWIKTYCKHNLIDADFIATRRFLLSLPIEDVYTHLLTEIDQNVQDTMIRGDETVLRWHDEMWMDYLNHPEESKRQWATEFYKNIDMTMRQARTSEEQESVKKGKVIPPYAPFLKAVFSSAHTSLQRTGFQQIIKFFADEWVCEYIWKAFESSDSQQRAAAVSKRALWILHTHNLLGDALIHMLQSTHQDLFLRAIDVLFYSTDEDVKKWISGMVDGRVIEILLSRMGEIWADSVTSPTEGTVKSWIDSAFIHRHFVTKDIFVRIPKPSLFGQNFEKAYFDTLSRVFVYETLEDIADDLNAYASLKKDLIALKNEGLKVQSLMKTDDKAAAKASTAWITKVMKRYASTPEKLGVVFKDQTIPELTFTQALSLVRNEIGTLVKPTPTQDKRFFDVLSMLTVAKGPWVDDLLKRLMSTFDEKLSNEAFNVYFTRGVQAGNAEGFLSSMIVDNHPRLDDVFGMLLSKRYGSIKSLRNVLGACTRLNRIDIVFQAFTKLAEHGLIELDAWDVLLESRHKYLRYRALQTFFFHKDEEIRTKYIKRHYKNFIQEPSPNSVSSIVSIKDIRAAVEGTEGQNEKREELHAFVKNGRSLKFHQLEALRKRFPMSPGFIRKVVSSDSHLLVSGLTYEAAADLYDACHKLGITLMFSQTNPLYADRTQGYWRTIVERCLNYIRENHWSTNERLAATVLDLDVHLQKHLSSDTSLRTLALDTLGSIAGPKNFEQMYAYLDGEYSDTVANALVRSGSIHGLRHIFADDNRTLVAMMTLGRSADLFVERTIQGALGANVQHKAIQMWLMQLAQKGGNADLMMTMLSTSSHEHMLLASELFGTMYEQSTFEQRVVELLKLEKIQLTAVPSEVNFHSVSRWENSMKLMRKAYVKHYCVEPDSSKPVVLADLRAAHKALKVADQNLKDAERSASSSGDKKHKAALQKAKNAKQQARDKLNGVNAELAKRYVTLEEWKWFARHMSSGNSRVSYLTAEWVVQMLDGSCNRKAMLEAQERIAKICSDNEVTLSEFTPLSLNGMTLTRESAVSFGFGSLAGIVRNYRNIAVAVRRKALASLIQLADKHPVPTISAVLSVAFNDPSRQIRRDAFVVALNHQESLGLSWEQIIRQASNAVSLRNAENASSRSSDVDILNQLIVSELNRADRQDLLLEMVRTQPHNLGYTALELLLNVESTQQDTVVAGLTAALKSPNRNIRNRLVNRIISEKQEVLDYNQRQLEEQLETNTKSEFLSDEPYWDLLVQCLDHGLTTIADAAADHLIEQSKRRDQVLEYVYNQWLNSFDVSKQRRACQALNRLRPSNATEKLLERVYVNNLTETADLSTIQNTLTALNQYASDICDKLLEAIDATRSTKRFSSDPSDLAFKLAYQVLIRYSGVSGANSIARVEIVTDIIKVLRKNSHYELLGSLMTQLARLPVSRYLSAELDTQLVELATNLTHAKLVRYRKQALSICVHRYLEMTPLLKDLPVSEHQKEPRLDSQWSTSGWAELKSALVQNMGFQETQSKDKDFLSEYQKMSAMALITTQGYTHEVFKMVRKILENKAHSVRERSSALEALVVTESIHLLGPLQRLLGMNSKGALSERALLAQGVETALYDRALALIGHYHYTEKKDDIFKYLVERWENTANHREPAVLTSLWRFKGYAEYQQPLLDILIAHQPHSSARKTRVDLPNTRKDYTSFHLWFDMVMELYTIEFGEMIVPLRSETAKKARRLILQELERVDVNRVYEFYLAHCATENIDVDLQLWKSRVHMFLTSDNRRVLKERIVQHGTKSIWMDLMLQGIQSAASQKKQSDVVEAMLSAMADRTQRLQDNPGQEPLLTLSDIEPLEDVLHSRENQPQVEVLFQQLFAYRTELSSEVLEWVVERYHQNELGAWFVFTLMQFGAMTPLDWQQEVDALEVVISREVSGVEFYIDLVNTYIDSEPMIFESVMDIVKHRDFSEEEEATLLGVVTAVRMEWTVLQREKAKGVQNQHEIEKIEERWNKILEFLDSLGDTGEELTEILTLDATPLFLKRSALKMYLKRQPNLEFLASLYTQYPSFKPMLAAYMNLGILNKVLNDSVSNLHEYKASLEQLTQRLDKVLKDRTDFVEFTWLVSNTLALGNLNPDVLKDFTKAVQAGDKEAVRKLLSIKSNRASIRQAVIYAVIAQTLQEDSPLTSMYWATVDDGEQIHSVVQHLIAKNVLDGNKLTPAIIVALSGAKSASVREAYSGLLDIFNKHREWNNRIELSRGKRYIKELS